MEKINKQKQITAREMARNYKEVLAQVYTTNEPTVITTGSMQVALIGMHDLRILQELKYKNSAKELLGLAHDARELLKSVTLPKDLSINHDKYLLEDD